MINNENIHQENKMGIMPVNKLLVTMSVPMIISMLIQALYNIVDSMFVAYVSENALTAVSLAFPIQNLMIAFGTGVGVGVNSLLAKGLGEKDYKSTEKTAGAGIFIMLVLYVIFAAFGILGTRTFFSLQTDNPEIIAYGIQYLGICCICSFGALSQFLFEKILQSTGKTMYTMLTQCVGAIINLILDPIMIFGYFGCPAMGVAGAAIATVIGQTVAGLLALYINISRNKEIALKLRAIRPNGSTIKKIFSVGAGSIVMMALSSVMNFGMNTILMGFTATATAVFGIYYKLQSFVFMPLYGLNNGMVPIISYNYGAEQLERVRKSIHLCLLYATCFMIVCTAAFTCLPDLLIGIFNASETMLEIGVTALRIIGISLVFAGFSIICSSVFQPLGKGLYSVIVSVFRQTIPLLPLAFVLSLNGNVNTVWWAIPIVEIMAAAICAFGLRSTYKTTLEETF